MEHVWSVLCQQAIMNELTHNASLVETLERITFLTGVEEVKKQISALDAERPPFSFGAYLVSMWWRTDPDKAERGEGRVDIKLPTLETVELYTYPIDLEQNRRFRSIGSISSIPFAGFGIYRFIVQSKIAGQWIEIATVPLEIGDG